MGELLVVISETNDIVYKQMYNKTGDEEYCRLLVLLYGCIDVLVEKMMSTNSNYFDCLDEYEDMRISVRIMPSGYKVLFIHNRKNVKQFLHDVHSLFATMIIAKPLSSNIMDDHDIHTQMSVIHRRHF